MCTSQNVLLDDRRVPGAHLSAGIQGNYIEMSPAVVPPAEPVVSPSSWGSYHQSSTLPSHKVAPVFSRGSAVG